MRSVTVLIKPESFSESILEDLIGRIGRRFPRPSLLYFNFYTSIDDIETPEEHDGPASSETPGLVEKHRNKEKHDAAVCVRLETGKYGNCHMIFANGSTRDISMPK